MKFSHTLSLNANPDWTDHYIDYASLKKLINELESSITTTTTEDDGISDEDVEVQRRELFLQKLTKMMTKVRHFYESKRCELDANLSRLKSILERDEQHQQHAHQKALLLEKQLSSRTAMTTSTSTATIKEGATFTTTTEESPLLMQSSLLSLPEDEHTYEEIKGNGSDNNQQQSQGMGLKSLSCMSLTGLEDNRVEICDLFTQYHNLKLYATLNGTAVRKILKKYDKVMHDNLKRNETFQFKIRQMLPFYNQDSDKSDQAYTPEIDHSLRILQDYFAHFYCHDNQEEALRRLQLMVREMVSYQRHTVWLDVIQDQRRHENAQIVDSAAPLDNKGSFFPHPTDTYTLKGQIIHGIMTHFGALTSLAFFLAILMTPGIFDTDPVKRNALALFVFVSLLWATEAFPLFVTSMLVPFLTVVLRVVVVDGHRLDAKAASQHAFAAMFSHVIMLLMGGFSIAAALSKHNIAKTMASRIARQCGSGVRTTVAVHLFLATFASMWISNVAAPVLCYSLIAPILKAATAGTSRAAFGTAQRLSAERDARLCRALVLAVALASNVGGMASPISSPQNLFAIEYSAAEHAIGWLQWFIVSIPLCIVLNIMIWAWLVYCFELPARTESAAVAHAMGGNDKQQYEPFTGTQNYVMVVSVGVILLWCANDSMESVTGQMGLLGIVPFVMFFGTGILSKEDLNNFLWSVVILAMGGLVLGEAVKTSGLLDVLAANIALFIQYHSLGLWETMVIFTALILFCTTFVSHTVGAIVVIPIVQAVGAQMKPVSHSNELVFAAALACSAAMGLPVSGFPNMTAVSVEDSLGNRYLTTKDFLKYALPASIFSLAVIDTLGYWLILVSVKIGQ